MCYLTRWDWHFNRLQRNPEVEGVTVDGGEYSIGVDAVCFGDMI